MDYAVKIGQVWKENDLRFSREVTIVALGPTTFKNSELTKEVAAGKVLIRSQHSQRYGDNSGLSKVKLTTASIARFNGKSSGYSLLKDAPNAQD